MKTVDKLKNKIKVDKNLFLFLVILLVVGLLAGSIFVTILNQNDKTLVQKYLNTFLNNIETDQLDYLLALKSNVISSFLFVVILWLLGISAIGLPIIVVMFFVKTFILGFSVGSMILTFGFKGTLLALIYAFPGQVISIFILLLLSMYAISFSMRLIYALLKKRAIDFKYMINRYVIILGIAVIGIVLMNVYDTYCVPYFIKSVLSFVR